MQNLKNLDWTSTGLRLLENLMFVRPRDLCDSFQVYDLSNLSVEGRFRVVRSYEIASQPNPDLNGTTCPIVVRKVHEIDWASPDGRSPVNKPACGYNNENCPNNGRH